MTGKTQSCGNRRHAVLKHGPPARTIRGATDTVGRRAVAATAMLGALLLGCAPSSAPPQDVRLLPGPAGAGSAEAHLARGPGGAVVLSWLEPVADGVALRFSTLGDAGWQPARTVAQGNDWFVNWADFPSVTPVGARLWAAHWLVKRAGGTYAYDVAMSLSTNAGKSWGDAFTPHRDGTRTEHGFVSLFPWQRGVGAVWLDGRNMGADGHDGHDGHENDDEHGAVAAGMTLRAALIGADATPVQEQLVDDLVCDCCQTDVAIAASGPVAVYRNRTPDEIRDIHVARLVDGRWDAGRPVASDGWEIAGCPVNGPAVAADGATVVTAWFTAAHDQPRVRFARSEDSGASFAAPLDIDVGQPLGRVDVELLGSGDAIVSWLRQGDGDGGEIVVRRVPASGPPGSVASVASTGASRASGFPQMVRRGDELVLASTDVSGDASTVRTALVAPP